MFSATKATGRGFATSLRRFLNYRIGQATDRIDLDRYLISVLQEYRRCASTTDPVGSARQNDRSGKKFRAATQKLDEPWYVENHIVCVPVLHDFAVKDRLDPERVRIGNLVGCHKAGS